ncbi:MAG: NAD-dependent epimerase/dehydratase family protein [Chloroflexi bacterium]|nr:NAD-dependent epimerase/dehydratase family protein [Chloroflexota bacterium]
MRALVTGGAGFIGSNLVQFLLYKGVEVRVLDNLSTGYRINLQHLPIDLVEGDIRDQDLVQQACRNIDIIFHLAASVGNLKSLNNPVEDAQVNILGMVNLVEAARKNQVCNIIYSSSAAIFGELLTMPIDENHPQNPNSPYGVSKLAAEKYLLCFAKLHGITASCLRYFNVYGLNQRYDAYGNVIPIFAQRLITGAPLTIYGDGAQTRDFVHVKDVAMANYLAATIPHTSGVYNIGSGTSITINELAHFIQESCGITASAVEYAPPRPGEVRHCRAGIGKARSILGFNPDTNIQDGLNSYMRWFKTSMQIAA